MDKNSLRIVYMGTPDFAVEPLRHLVEGGYNVVGCVTMPDKEAGRGHKIQFSPVKEYALSQNIPLLQPVRLKSEEFLSELKALNADLQIVVAFRMLPQEVWDMPRLGTFNLHASLLPQYRGAAPINWAVINGEKETGVTTFFLTHEIDTGKIILQEKIAIGENECVGDIHDKLMNIGSNLVTQTVDQILNEEVVATEQKEHYESEADLKPAPKIFKETCKIDWTRSCADLHNFVRGLSPYPAAWGILKSEEKGELVTKIFETDKLIQSHNHPVGTIIADKKSLMVAVADGFLQIKSLQLPSKKRITAEEFLRGFKEIESFHFE